MLELIALLTFATAFLIGWYVLRPKDTVVMRRRLGIEASRDITSERQLQGGLMQRTLLPALGQVGAVLTRFLPHRLVAHAEHMLIMANSQMPLPVFLGIWG